MSDAITARECGKCHLPQYPRACRCDVEELRAALDDLFDAVDGERVHPDVASCLKVIETMLCESGNRNGEGHPSELAEWREARAESLPRKRVDDE